MMIWKEFSTWFEKIKLFVKMQILFYKNRALEVKCKI